MPARRFFLICFVAALAVPACNRSAPQDPYAQALTAARAKKDDMLRRAGDSPVPAVARAVILPLPYFPPDPAYRVPASLVPDPAARVVEMLTSTGKRRQVEVLGTLRFVLTGQPLKLTAFAEEEPNGQRLFVPFTDATSGGETYGGGRYLDLERTATGIYIVDFNTAYNPYCAYNPTYDCPVPPLQNRLPVPIRAGEKAPRGH
jgi:hypothetical protein